MHLQSTDVAGILQYGFNGVGGAMVAQRIVIPLVASSSLVLHPIGLLTQLVECLPYTQNVGGSIPSQPTIVKCITGYFCYSWSL